MKASLIIADDHHVVRQGLCDFIARTSDLQVVGQAADGAEAESLARSIKADLMILDIAMPVRRGIQILESLRADGISLPVLFFSMYSASQYVDYAKRAGAQGFVGKDADEAELLRAIRRIVAGGKSFPGQQSEASKTMAGDDLIKALSRRELEVMQGLISGTSIVEIAETLGVSSQSVTTYRRRLLEKLGVEGNAELIALAILHGYR
jgi:DNA-binding NarL/FixJ family response regulator